MSTGETFHSDQGEQLSLPIDVPEVDASSPEQPYVRPTSAIPSRNPDAGGFTPIPNVQLTPRERLVADEPPAHIRQPK